MPGKAKDQTSSGDNADVTRITVSLPANIYEKLIAETSRRKINREKSAQMSAIVREAIDAYLPD